MRLLFLTISSVFALSLSAKSMSYQYKDKEYEIDYIDLKAKKTIFIVHDWDGLNEYELKRAKMFSDKGFNVLAIDIYGKGVRPNTLEEKKKTSSFYYSNRNLMLEAVKGAIVKADELKMPKENRFLVGYCFGGTVGLEIARNTNDFSKYFIFHGGLKTPENQSYKNNKGELYIYHGGADQAVSLQDVSDLSMLLEKNQQKYLVQIYSGAPHAFTHFDSDRYRKDADLSSWKHMLSSL